MKSVVQLFLAMLILLLPAAVAFGEESQQKPNIVFIVADDLGWADLGCYGSDLHETPNLDRLAHQGMRFTDAYTASPVCTPTRVSFLTGKHPARLHMTIWREAALQRGNRKLLEPVCLDSLPIQEKTFAECLRDEGYYNVHIGKWHIGRAESYPPAHGFHENIGGTLWGAPQTFWYPFSGDSYFADWRYVPDLEPSAEGAYLTDRLTDKAIEIIERQAATKRPFMINLWYHSVHTPIEGKPSLVKHYQEKIGQDHVQRNPYYAAMVHSLDENVGRVLAKIDELGIGDNTLVVFTSDNGGFVNPCKLHPGLAVANNSPLRSGKGSCYEGGIRVPLIVRGPQVAENKECSTPVVSCDLFPTFLDVSRVPHARPDHLDGNSLVGVLKNEATPLEREALFFHYPHYYPTTTPVSAIRKGDWKLLHYYEGNRMELYNLTEDIGETQNLISVRPEIGKQLRSELDAWRTQVGALQPEVNPRKQ